MNWIVSNSSSWVVQVATCRYWHRSINPKKLIEVKFSHLSRNMTMQRHLKLYRLPDQTKVMQPADCCPSHVSIPPAKCQYQYLTLPACRLPVCGSSGWKTPRP